ncbi:MAG: hypothetical protein DRI71_04120 [Bacteroidetes bacterium]|nr:MAG: hypothetical protein DRI71_04120 [Bacteroidota bacterium]
MNIDYYYMYKTLAKEQNLIGIESPQNYWLLWWTYKVSVAGKIIFVIALSTILKSLNYFSEICVNLIHNKKLAL